jgi:regulator of Ty1 transposition protein 103
MYSLDEDKSVMQDMEVRQKIANFPSQLYNVDLLSTLKSKESCDNVLKDLNDSLEILTGYNKRLEDELKERKELEEMLDSFIWQQHGHLYKAKEKHKEYQLKMQKCSQVKESLKSHIASLPDLVKSDTEPLAPLPSAGDLFS